MNIYIASDHAGFDYKEFVKKSWPQLNSQFQMQDLGPQNTTSVDYPDFANLVAEKIKSDLDQGKKSFGILICGSGQGMCMRANKFSWIRAALCWSEEITRLSRQHNDANVICLGSRVQSQADCLSFIKVFVQTEFEAGRHLQRVAKLSASSAK